jgi:hypothetical protein
VKKQSLTLIALVGASLALASCGGESTPTEAAGSIDSATLSALASTTALTDMKAAIVPSASGSITPPLSGLPTGVGFVGSHSLYPESSIYASCMTATGSDVDGADADDIPSSYREDYDCNEIPIPGHNGTSTMTGYISKQDYDDTKYGILGGYMFDFDLNYDQKFSHENNVGNWSGSWGVVISGNTINLVSTFSSEAGSIPTTGEPASLWKATSNFSTAYTPTNAAAPWQAGSVVFSGFSRFSGTLYDNTLKQSYDLDVTFKIESTGLTYDRAACPASFFQNGTYKLTDGAGNVLAFTYVNCTETRTFNGASI